MLLGRRGGGKEYVHLYNSSSLLGIYFRVCCPDCTPIKPKPLGCGSVISLCLGFPIGKTRIITESTSRPAVVNELIQLSDLEQRQADRNAEVEVNNYSTL